MIEKGIANLEPWRWIFLLEGLATIVTGVAVFWSFPDSPERAAGRWLTHEEARFLRLNNTLTRGVKSPKTANAQSKKERFKWNLLKQVAKDWQIYLQAMVLASNVVPLHGLKL